MGVEVFGAAEWVGLVRVMRSKMSSGSSGISVNANAGGVLDGVEDRGRGAVHGQFADAFGAPRAVDRMGVSSKWTWMGGRSALVGMM